MTLEKLSFYTERFLELVEHVKLTERQKLLLLWVIANYVTPQLIYYANIVELENSFTTGPIVFVLVQFTNLIYYDTSRKLFFCTMIMNIFSILILGSFSFLTSFYEIYILFKIFIQ